MNKRRLTRGQRLMVIARLRSTVERLREQMLVDTDYLPHEAVDLLWEGLKQDVETL